MNGREVGKRVQSFPLPAKCIEMRCLKKDESPILSQGLEAPLLTTIKAQQWGPKAMVQQFMLR
jgi:hypothetical protein